MVFVKPALAYMIGSVSLGSGGEVLNLVADQLGDRVDAVPDGETGERKSFVQWQRVHIPASVRKPMFDGTPGPSPLTTSLTIKDIAPLRYDDFAIESYRLFAEMRASGRFSPGTRFQVCLPTPLSVVRSLVKTEYCAQVEPLYEARLLQALHRIQNEIPVDDLLIQWDMPIEMAMLELNRGKLKDPFFVEFFQPYFFPVRQGILDRFGRLFRAVSPRAKMALHMCYGNYQQKHWLEPENVDLLVDTANSLMQLTGLHRPIDYVQMPVPKDQTGPDYLEALNRLELGSATLVLGLIHGFDLDGTVRRIQAASQVCQLPYGVSTECGLTNKPLDYVQSVMNITARVLYDQD